MRNTEELNINIIVSASAKEAVRASFNPSALSAVGRIKVLGAALITECEQVRDSNENEDTARAASVAITGIETAVMWAVKAATT